MNHPVTRGAIDAVTFVVGGGIEGVAALANLGKSLFSKTVAKAGTKGTYSVYRGFDAAGKTKYVGITGRDAATRFGEHAASGTAKSTLQYRVIDGATGLSKIDARIWEQTLINQHGLNNLYNIRNSIAPQYWWQYGIFP
jgi:hypothetical protein